MSSPDVVVVTYRSREQIVPCARAALAAGAGRLIVVDNASPDGTAELVAEQLPAAELIRVPSNEGFARGVNRGVAAGDAETILLLNPDARLTAAALDRLHAALAAAPEVAAVGPRIRTPDGALELSVDRTMSPLADLTVKLLERLYAGGRGPIAGWLERHYARARSVRALSGACLLVRRAALEQVGGLDEGFFLYSEDVDLCLRLRAAGWKLRYEPAAEVLHARGASARQEPLVVERAWRDSQLRLYARHRPAWLPLLRGWLRLRYALRARFGPADGRARARELAAWLDRPEARR